MQRGSGQVVKAVKGEEEKTTDRLGGYVTDIWSLVIPGICTCGVAKLHSGAVAHHWRIPVLSDALMDPGGQK